ncbi:hypothetical protein M514_02515 [Trichuris suis]|uniref:Uncharacterized protein n=1 Tax=Trichuris suis TaxID=68888 RepID=A0A085NN93_9BILA|nr:hypothetical protein M513_02515 [Trichuris suis]KFD70939.1 hypothetical protein M514_02515 [Trichuris suis]
MGKFSRWRLYDFYVLFEAASSLPYRELSQLFANKMNQPRERRLGFGCYCFLLAESKSQAKSKFANAFGNCATLAKKPLALELLNKQMRTMPLRCKETARTK